MLLYAWIAYFGIWAISFLLINNPSKIVIAIMAVISIIDIVYLAMNDGRTLILVLLATGFAVAGVVRAMLVQFKDN